MKVEFTNNALARMVDRGIAEADVQSAIASPDHLGPCLDKCWHARKRIQVFAGWGYVTAWHNFHGSSGFGQAFTDAINPDQITKPYQDTIDAPRNGSRTSRGSTASAWLRAAAVTAVSSPPRCSAGTIPSRR